MDAERLRELEQLLEEATPGPWVAETASTADNPLLAGDAVVWSRGAVDKDGDSKFVTNIGPSRIGAVGVAFDHEEADARFIAAARNALPDLLAYVRQLEADAEVGRLFREACERWPDKVVFLERSRNVYGAGVWLSPQDLLGEGPDPAAALRALLEVDDG